MIEAAAWAGMSENDFWATTPRYFHAIIKGRQRDDREKWMMARQVAYWTILPHMGKKQIRPTALARFPWERASQLEKMELTPELKADIANFKEMALKLLN